LADNGTLFWWGHALKIAYSQVVLDKYFELLNSLVWQKYDGVALKNSPEGMRSFAPITERCLMYSTGFDVDFLTKHAEDPNAYLGIKTYMREQKALSGLKEGQIRQICGNYTVGRHCFGNSQWEFITRENYEKLQAATGLFARPWGELRAEFEELRAEFDKARRAFSMDKLQTDVLVYGQENHLARKAPHPTRKPEALTAYLLNTCSRPGDLVLVPFAGSGTECAVAVRYGRKFVAYEIDEKHVKTARRRVAAETIPIF